jgi:hypothetical protein
LKKKLSSKAKLLYSALLVLFLVYSVISVKKSYNDDFRAYYQAGSLISSRVNIYEHGIVEGGYLYSPTFAVLLIPLSWLPQIPAATLWYIGNIISLILLILLSIYLNVQTEQKFTTWVKTHFLRYDKNNKLLLFIVFTTFIVSARFWLNNIEHGQINLQIWCMALFSIYFRKQNRYLLSGLLLGLVIIIKVLPLLLLFYFLVKRDLKIIYITVLFIIGLLMFPSIIIGWHFNIDLLQYWYSNVMMFSYNHLAASAGDSNQSLPAMIVRFLSNVPGNEETGQAVNLFSFPIPKVLMLAGVLQIIFISIIPFIVIQRKVDQWVKENIEISVLFISAVLLPPLAWKAYYVASIMAYATLIYLLLNKRINFYRKTIIIFIVLSFLFHTFTSDGIWGWKFAHIYQSYSCVTISMLFLYLSLLFALLNFRRQYRLARE